MVCFVLCAGNSSASTGGEGAAPPPPEPDPALDSMHMMLDPHLRPISPDLNNEESKRIFEEHKQLAQEYLKVGFTHFYFGVSNLLYEEKASSVRLYFLASRRFLRFSKN